MSATQVPTDQLTLTLLGPPGWRRDADAQAPLSRLDAAMLALLVLDGEQPRDRLAAWLWPKVSQRGANLNLRQRIFRLRRDTGHRLIDAGQVLRLTAGVQSDLDADGEWPVEGKLLGGFDFGDCEALDEWMTSARLRCLTRQLDRLAGQASRQEAQGALAAAIATCDRLLARAPLHEHGWRRLMRLHFLRGDRASAIEAFERFETLVRTEQGSRPSPETIALLHEIERMDAAPPDAAGSAVRLLPSLLRPPQLVGRQGALQALTLAGHAGRAALVIAPAGFGKSRLIADFLQGCPGALTSSGQPGDAAMPYALAARLLRAVLERFTPSLQDGVRVELSRLLPELAEAPGGVGQQRLLWQAVFTALVGARANGLAAVAVDDLQFADAASLELLRWLIASAALSDLHFVFATRPEERGDAAPAWRAWLDDSVRIEPVVLGPWTEAEVLALLRSLSLPGLSPLDLAGALHRHAGGHPFLTLETLKHLVLNGGGGGATLPQPAAAQSMIQRRFAGLSAPAVELLHLAAVAGGGLHPQWAAQVLQRRLMQLAAPWAELEAAQILQGSGFAHDLVRQAALAEVPTPVRQALHRALAESCADLQPLAPVLVARHWLGAEDWAAAVPWLRMGARAARTAGRLAEQQALLEQAVDACQRAGDPDGAFDAACDALSGITIRLGSEASLARIDELQVLAATAGQRARLAVARSEALFNLARFDDARQAADDALALAPAGSEEQAHAIALQGRALALTGQCGAALVRLEKALAPGPGPDDRPRLLAVRSALAHALSAVGRVGEALHEQTLAAELAEGIGDAGELAQALANLATLAFIAGKTPDAWRHAQDAERRFVAMDSQDALHGVFNRIVLGRAAAHLGRLDQALQALQAAALAPSQQVGAVGATIARTALASHWVWLGQPRRAFDDLSDRLPDGHPSARLAWWQVRARAAECAGLDPGPDRALASRLLREHPALLDEPLLLVEWARWAPPEAALARLRAAAAKCRRLGRAPLARTLALCALGRLIDIDPVAAEVQARRLTAELPQGLFAASYPPEAWWTLARAQHGAAAAACQARALAWIRDVALTQLDPAWQHDFITGNPVNRVLWSAAGLTPPAPVTAA